jgi:hypothetical protein
LSLPDLIRQSRATDALLILDRRIKSGDDRRVDADSQDRIDPSGILNPGKGPLLSSLSRKRERGQ